MTNRDLDQMAKIDRDFRVGMILIATIFILPFLLGIGLIGLAVLATILGAL